MDRATETTEIVIIGAGPIGLACGIEAKLAGIPATLLEKGCLLNSIYYYPTNVVFFSTPERLELGNIPFLTAGQKPTRIELLQYYTRLAQHFQLEVRLFEQVRKMHRDGEGYVVQTDAGKAYFARYVIVAAGFYDNPNLLDIPGEDLPKVTHYYKEAHPYFKQRVAIIGGQNSAAEAALEIFRAGAEEVSLIHRGAKFGEGIKYWILPDLENRIEEGGIHAYFNSEVARITEKTIVIRGPGGETLELENDFVLALTGYHPDFRFLQSLGLELESRSCKPVHNPETMESNLEDVYIAGVIAGGWDANKIFIENGRVHAKLIFEDITRKQDKVH